MELLFELVLVVVRMVGNPTKDAAAPRVPPFGEKAALVLRIKATKGQGDATIRKNGILYIEMLSNLCSDGRAVI